MNIKRFLSGIIGLPLVALILILGNKYVIDITISVVAVLCLYEYFKCLNPEIKNLSWIAYIAAISISFLHVIPPEINLISLIIPISVLTLFFQIIITNMKYNIKDISSILLAICYIVIFLIYIPIIRNLNNGKILIWFIFISAWGTDTFAYFIGKKFGKHKFSKISPNKSIEGCIAGIIGATMLNFIYVILCNKYLGMNFNYCYIIILSIILSIIGQLGDFAASSIKRYYGIKDFSNLIPGHGGMLDRVDSVIFIAPFAYFLLMLI